MKYQLKDFAKLIDHTDLNPAATHKDMENLCTEAKDYGFAMVAINQVQTALCHKYLEGTDVHTGAAVGFPLGQTTVEVKEFETKNAIQNGADEIDYVINLTEVKEKNYDYIEDEMNRIVNICKENNIISKVIFENAYLTEEEIIELSKIAKRVKPDFVKTSTGHASSGAKVEDVKLMKESVGNEVKVKAAGGIRDADSFIEMIQSGAERIGSSSGIKIIEELKQRFEEDKIEYMEV